MYIKKFNGKNYAKKKKTEIAKKKPRQKPEKKQWKLRKTRKIVQKTRNVCWGAKWAGPFPVAPKKRNSTVVPSCGSACSACFS
jgi:hypothetical protein